MKTVKETAEKLGISYEACRMLIAAGEIVAVNVSAGVRPSYRISDDEIDAFVARRSTSKPSTARRKPSRKPKREWV